MADDQIKPLNMFIVLAEFQKRLGKRSYTCELCGESNPIGGSLIKLPIQADDAPTMVGGIRFGGRILALMDLSCGNCGNTKLLNLVTLGLWPKGGEKPGETPAQAGERLADEALGDQGEEKGKDA